MLGIRANLAASPLDSALPLYLPRYLFTHVSYFDLSQDVLLPSANNVSTIFVGREDVLEFITVQEWVNAKLNLQLQLLTGVFVAVPAAGMEPSSSRESLQAEKAVPVRIRQVKSVRVSGAAAGGPEQAKVLLVGGGVLEAGQLGEQPLLESQDNEVRGND